MVVQLLHDMGKQTEILQSVLLILPENIDALKRTNLPYRVDLNTECQMLNQLNNFFLPSYYSKLVTIREYKRQFEAEYTMMYNMLLQLKIDSTINFRNVTTLRGICQEHKMRFQTYEEGFGELVFQIKKNWADIPSLIDGKIRSFRAWCCNEQRRIRDLQSRIDQWSNSPVIVQAFNFRFRAEKDACQRELNMRRQQRMTVEAFELAIHICDMIQENVACLINLMSHVSSALQYIVNICQTIKMEEDQLISHVVTDNVHANEYILERIQDTWNELLKMVDRLLNY